MMKLSINTNEALKKSAFIALLQDFINLGYSKFSLNVNEDFKILTCHQLTRDHSCSFQCNDFININSNLIFDLISSLNKNNKEYILNHKNTCLTISFY